RQPWTISGVLPTFLSVSSLEASSVYASLGAFIAFYTVLFAIEMYLMLKYIRLGPGSLGTGRYFGEAGVPIPGASGIPRPAAAGGVLFAAWPLVYAASFSGMYLAMLLVLFALFFRPVGFKYRNKVADRRWRTAWDWGLFIGGFVPALVFGIAFGNLLQGVPFHFDADMHAHYTGTFWQLLNPFALLTGVISVAMLAMHGASYLCLRVDGVIHARAARTARIAGTLMVVAFAASGLWVATGIDGYRITMIPDLNGLPNPLAKTVAKVPGAWLDNYGRFPWTLAAPVGAFTGAFGVIVFAGLRRP